MKKYHCAECNIILSRKEIIRIEGKRICIICADEKYSFTEEVSSK